MSDRVGLLQEHQWTDFGSINKTHTSDPASPSFRRESTKGRRMKARKCSTKDLLKYDIICALDFKGSIRTFTTKKSLRVPFMIGK